MSQRRLNVAILGQGRSGKDIHAKILEQMPEYYRIAAVVDGMEERRQRAIEDYGCDAYETHEELFERDDIDLVVNATPSHLHVPLTLEFLEKGFNVLCEKPLARKAEDVDRLIEASKTSGKLLSVFQQSRFQPAFMEVQRIIESGVIGRVVQAKIAYNGFGRRWDWQTLKKFNGGNLLNTGPHPVDQALQIFGVDEQEPDVFCIMDKANSFGDAEDYVKLVLRGENKPCVEVEISSCNAYANHNYHIQGTLGGIYGSLTGLEWRYYKPEEAPSQQLVEAPLQKEDGSPAYGSEELKWYEHSWKLPFEGRELFNYTCGTFYKNLYDTLENGSTLIVKPEHVRMQIAVMEESFRQNPLFA